MKGDYTAVKLIGALGTLLVAILGYAATIPSRESIIDTAKLTYSMTLVTEIQSSDGGCSKGDFHRYRFVGTFEDGRQQEFFYCKGIFDGASIRAGQVYNYPRP